MKRNSINSVVGRLAKLTVLVVMLSLPALFGASWALAQDTRAVADQELEEIIVVAPRTFTRMRAEILRAEEHALDLYNELNTDDDYDIRCQNETLLDSHIPERVCRPVYVMRMEAREAQDFMDFGISMGLVEDAAQHERVFRENMAQLTSENPALLEALQHYYDAKTTYDIARQERFRSN